MNLKIFITHILLLLLLPNLIYSQANRIVSDSLSTIEFSFVGDIMCHSTQFKFAQVSKDSFNFKPNYREIKLYFDNSDVVVGNLETVVEVSGVSYSGYPVFNTPKDFLEGLKYAGFNILTTANNHSFDINERGVLSTIEHIKNYGMKNVGSYNSKTQRDSVIIFETNRIKFAILSYTYGVNLYQISKNKSYLVNKIDEEIIKNDIKNYRQKGAEVIIVAFHFGLEYSTEPNYYQSNIVKKTIDFGADIIIGAHPHTLQPLEYFTTVNTNIDSGFVAYSIGNFISNQRWRYSDGGAVLNFSIEKNNLNGRISIEAVRYLPIWVFKGNTKNGSEYIILPTEVSERDSIPYYLSNEDLRMMNECSNDTHLILTKVSSKIEKDSIQKSKFRKIKRNYLANGIFESHIPSFGMELDLLKIYSDTLNYMQQDSVFHQQIYD